MADGGSAGNGGTIQINGLVAINNHVSPVLSAVGKSTGEGGNVTIAQVDQQFDVNKLINVDGGNQLPILSKDGSISLNGLLCQQWRVDSAFPKAYWNCVNPSSPTSHDLTPVTVLASLNQSVKNSLEANNAELYVMFDASSAQTFFKDPNIEPNEGGFTFELDSNDQDGSLVIMPYQRGSIGGAFSVTYTTDEYTEVSAHEVGHAIDFSILNPSVTADFAKFVLRDFAELDYAFIDPDNQGNSIPRLPCAPTPDGQGGFFAKQPPFEGVMVINTPNPFPICNGAIVDETFANMTNSEIFMLNEVLWNPDQQDLWREGYPQGIAFLLAGKLGGRPVNDDVFDNSYFDCVKLWANENLNSGTNPQTSACPAPPNWYALP